MKFKRKILKKIKLAFYTFVIVGIVISIYFILKYVLIKNGFDKEVVGSTITSSFTTLTFLGAMATIYFTWKGNKEKNLVEIVTKNRADWVKEMKVLFSDYFTRYDELKYYEKNAKIEGETLVQIKNKISLRLNPNGIIDNEILDDLNNLTNKFGQYRKSTLRDKTEIKIKLYLKCEWERIKFETKEGLEEYDFEYEFKKIQVINYFTNKEKLSKKLYNILTEVNLIKKELNKEELSQKEFNKIKKVLYKIEKDKISRNKVIDLSKKIEY